MAQVFRLVLKIQAQGQEVFKQTSEDLKKFNVEVQKTSTEPFDKIAQSTQKINENIQGISKQFSNVIKSVVAQTSGALAESVDTISSETGKSFETLLSRIAVGTGVISSLAILRVDNIFTEARASSKGFFSFLSSFSTGFFGEIKSRSVGLLGFFQDRISGISGLIDNIAFGLGSALNTTQKTGIAASGLSQAFTNISTAFGPITKGLGVITGGAGTFLAINVALRETTLLFRRFLGYGTQAVTPLERVSNIIITVDESFRNVELRAGSVLKTVGLFASSALAFQAGPLFGIATALSGVNSLISNILQLGIRGRLQFLSFFGSSRAALGLIFFDLKRIATEALPNVEKNAKAMTAVEKNAKAADVALKGVGGDLQKITQLQAVSRSRFTLGEQFQLFALEIKQFIPKIIEQINRIFNLMSVKFGLTQNELKAIDKTAKLTAVSALKDVTNVTSGVEGIFKKSREGAGIFKTLGLSMKNSLADAVTAPGRSFKKLFDDIRQDFFTVKKQVNFDQLNLGKISKAVSVRNTGTSLTPKIELPKVEKDSSFDKTKNAIEDIRKTLETFKKDLPKAFDALLVGPFLKALDTAKNSVEKLKGSISNIPKAFERTPSAINAIGPSIVNFKQSIDRVGESVKKIPESFTGIRNKLKTISQEIFDLQKAPVLGARKNLGESQRKNIGQEPKVFEKPGATGVAAGLLIPFKKFSEGAVDVDIAIKALKNFEKIAVDIAKTVGGDAKNKIAEFQRLFSAGKFKVDVDKNAFKGLFKVFEESITEASKVLGIRGKSLPDALIQSINESFRSGKGRTEVEKAISDLTNLIAEFFPASPAKRGALKKLPKMGTEIGIQLAGGMKQGKKEVATGAEILAEQIAGYFPRSLPLFGPLRLLIKSGFGIAQLLASGIRSGVNLISDAANFLADEFDKTIKKAVNLEFMSQRVGASVEVLSSFNTALATVGGSVQDLEFSLVSVNKTLSDAFSGEKLLTLENLGIDINKVRQSVNPSIELLLSVSDVLKDLPPQSKEFQQALELIGVTSGNSPLIPFLRKGREEIIRLQEQGVNLGAIYDTELTKMSVEFQGITNQATIVRETLFNELVKQVLPNLIEFGNKVLEIVEKNSSKIKAFFSIFGQLISLGIQSLAEFIKFATENPQKASDAVLGILKSFARLAFNLFDTLFNFTKDRLLRFLKEVALLLVELPKQIIINAFLALTDQIQIQIQKLLFGIQVEISNSLKTIPGLKKTLDFVGLGDFVISEDEIAGLQDKIDRAEKNVLGFGEAIDQAFEDSARVVKDQVGKVQQSFEDLINSNLKDDITEDFVGLINDLSDAVKGTPLEGVTDKIKQVISLGNIEAEVQKYEKIQDAQIKLVQNTGEAVRKEGEKVKQAEKQFAITLISKETIQNAQARLKEFQFSVKSEIEAVSKIIKDTLEFNPFLAMEIGLEAFKNATGEQARLLGDDLKSVFGKVAELDPFKAMRESLALLKVEAGGLKEKVAADLFSQSVGSSEFQKQTKSDPDESLATLSEGFNATSEENIGAIEPAFTEGFQQATEADPFASLAASFDLFINNTGEKGKLAGEAFSGAFQASATKIGDTIGQVGSIIGSVMELTGRKSKALFIAQKALAVAQATINIAQGVTKAIAEGGVAGIITGVAVAAAGAVQIANIISQKPPEFQEGGLLSGPSHAQGGVPLVNSKGQVFAEAEGGEFIVSKKATAYAGRSFLEAVNNLQISRKEMHQIAPNIPSATLNFSRRFADGGMLPPAGSSFVSAKTDAQSKETPIQIVNVPDASLAERYIASNRGERQILNIIQNNSEAVKKSIGVR